MAQTKRASHRNRVHTVLENTTGSGRESVRPGGKRGTASESAQEGQAAQDKCTCTQYTEAARHTREGAQRRRGA
jgi:hypothetical protein